MNNAKRLQSYRSNQMPVRMRADLLLQPLCIVNVAPQPNLQIGRSFAAQQPPQFHGPKAPAEWYTPVPIIRRVTICGGLQITGVGTHYADQMLFVAYIVDRAIEHHTQPLMRIKYDRVCAFDTVPQ